MKFKFIGAGQIFRPTESQQLAVLNDRAAAELVRGKRGATALPLAIFGVVVVAGAIGAWVYTRPHGPAPVASTTATAAPSPDQDALAQAERLCAAGDCDAAHDKLAALAETSAVRSGAEFRDSREPLGGSAPRQGRRRAGRDAQAGPLPAGLAGDGTRLRATPRRRRQAPVARRRRRHHDRDAERATSGVVQTRSPGARDGPTRRGPPRCPGSRVHPVAHRLRRAAASANRAADRRGHVATPRGRVGGRQRANARAVRGSGLEDGAKAAARAEGLQRSGQRHRDQPAHQHLQGSSATSCVSVRRGRSRRRSRTSDGAGPRRGSSPRATPASETVRSKARRRYSASRSSRPTRRQAEKTRRGVQHAPNREALRPWNGDCSGS